jgi:protein gp37
MGEQTAIEWADATWNPWWGCTKVSPACAHCYAETLADRFHHGLWRGDRRRMQDWALPAKVDRRAAREGRRLRLFVASMADVFDDHPVVGPWRREALELLATLRNVDVLLLTKRPQNILRMVPWNWTNDGKCDFRAKPELWPAHIWVGTTVEDQQRADERVPFLLRVPAPVRFVSYEPALGPVDFTRVRNPGGESSFGPMNAFSFGLSWVIAGGESGPKARPSHPDWYRSVRDQCKAAGVPFLFKQWGEWVDPADLPSVPGRSTPTQTRRVWPDGATSDLAWPPRPASDSALMLRAGKKAAGRLLDGVQHDGYPGCAP